jgi:uncharacterized membrane protein YuzA (DUF378 family)
MRLQPVEFHIIEYQFYILVGLAVAYLYLKFVKDK